MQETDHDELRSQRIRAKLFPTGANEVNQAYPDNPMSVSIPLVLMHHESRQMRQWWKLEQKKKNESRRFAIITMHSHSNMELLGNRRNALAYRGNIPIDHHSSSDSASFKRTYTRRNCCSTESDVRYTGTLENDRQRCGRPMLLWWTFAQPYSIKNPRANTDAHGGEWKLTIFDSPSRSSILSDLVDEKPSKPFTRHIKFGWPQAT